MLLLLAGLAHADCTFDEFGGTLPAGGMTDVPTQVVVRWEILGWGPMTGADYRIVRASDGEVVTSTTEGVLPATLEPQTAWRFEIVRDDIVADSVPFETGSVADSTVPDAPVVVSTRWLTVYNDPNDDYAGGTSLTLEFAPPSEPVSWLIEWADDDAFSQGHHGPYDYFGSSAVMGSTHLCSPRPGYGLDPTLHWIRLVAVDRAGNASGETVIAPHAVDHEFRGEPPDEGTEGDGTEAEGTTGERTDTPGADDTDDTGAACACSSTTPTVSWLAVWSLLLLLGRRRSSTAPAGPAATPSSAPWARLCGLPREVRALR